MTSKPSLGMPWQRLQPCSLINRPLHIVRAHSPDIFGQTRFATISQTSGAGPRPSDASSNMRRKPRRALKMSHPQRTPLYHSGLASIRRYPCAPSLVRPSRTWTPWEFFCIRIPSSRAQQPYMQRTNASEDLGRQPATSSDTHATFAD